MKDANQIAQEAERRERRAGLQPPPRQEPVQPRLGSFTVMTDFRDDAGVIFDVTDVTVQITPAGIVVVTAEDGEKMMFKPIEGWAMLFDPNPDAEG